MVKRRYNSLDELPQKVRRGLSRFVSKIGARTFVIKGLPPELTGGVLARYSRASTGLQLTLANEFLNENGAPNQQAGSELMDRVLNAFGDESVGELEGAHVGLEDISQLQTKIIEDRRIGGSPIEQSTRYVKYDQKDKEGRWRYFRPKELPKGSPVAVEFERTNDRAFEVYSEGVKRLIDHFRAVFPREEFTIRVKRGEETIELHKKDLETDEERKNFRIGYNFTVRCAALDVGRCVLPSSTLTHIGIFGNGRFYTNLITKLKSSELEEDRERGRELEEALNTQIPTFIKRNRFDIYAAQREQKMRGLTSAIFSGIEPRGDKVTLVERADHLDEVLASSFFPYTNISLQQILDVVKEMPFDHKVGLFREYIGNRDDRRDRSGRGLEASYPITFDLVGGFAEYRDLERHRMLTQQRQMLTTELGFIMPPEMEEIGLEKDVEEIVGMMEGLNDYVRRAGFAVAAQYAILFNHRMRWMMGMNLREFQHLSELRTQPAGHFSYRSMVMEMADTLKARDPWSTAAYEFVNYSDPGNRITRAKEQSRIAGKNLAADARGDVDF